MQSSGGAQYPKKKARSKKNAFRGGSAVLRSIRFSEPPAGTALPLLPMATNSSLFFLSFLFRQARRNRAYRKRFLFRCRLQDFAEALTDRRPVVAGGGLDGGFFVTAPQFRIAQQHDDRLRERTGIVGQNNVAAVMNIQSFGADGGGDDRLGGRHGLVDLQTRTASDAQGHDDYGGLVQMLDD